MIDSVFKRNIKYISVIILLAVIMLPFQNCSKPFEVAQLASTSEEVDLSSPEIIFYDSPELVNVNSITISFEVQSSSISQVECQLSTETVAKDCSSFSVSYTNLADGDYSLQVTATKYNDVQASATKNFRIDTKKPILKVSSAPALNTSLSSAQFIFSATDELSGVDTITCSLDSANFTNCTSPSSLSNLSLGAHNYRIRARDYAGNVSVLYNYTWTVEQASIPSVAIESAPQNFTKLSNTSIVFSGQNVNSFECRLDSAAFSKCTSPINYTNLSSASHNFYLRGVTSSGAKTDVAVASWTVDTINPSTPKISTGVLSITNQTSASFNFSATDENGIASYQCKLDAQTYVKCVSPNTYSNLSNGSYKLFVRAIDLAGNISLETNFNWTVDTTNPTISFTKTPSDSTSTTATFEFSASDENGINLIQCSLDSATFANCTSPKNLAALGAGAHNYRVQAKDTAGNVRLISHSWTVTSGTMPTTNDMSLNTSVLTPRVCGDFKSAGYNGGQNIPQKAATTTRNYAAGRFVINDIIELTSNEVLSGAGPDKTTLYFPRGVTEILQSCNSARDCWSWSGGLITAKGKEIGIQNLTIEFPEHSFTHYDKTLGAQPGYNGIHFSGCTNCWAKNIRVVNSDFGIGASSSNNVTIQNTSVFANANGSHLHYAISSSSKNVLINGFSTYNTSHHGLTAQWKTASAVFTNGFLNSTRIEPDHNEPSATDLTFTLFSNLSGKTASIQKTTRYGIPVTDISSFVDVNGVTSGPSCQ